MQTWETLKNPPVVEGLIDVRIAPLPSSSLGKLRDICESLRADYPQQEEIQSWQTRFLLGPTQPQVDGGQSSQLGRVLRSVDEKTVMQLRLDGFTFSKLKPYSTWSEVLEGTKQIWGMYKQLEEPLRVQRVAARYINQIPVKSGHKIEDYFRSTFVVPDTLPQYVEAFLLRFAMPFEEQGITAILTQSLDPNNANSCVVFDIDVFFETDSGIGEVAAMEKLEELRRIKNDLFFNSLTEKALELFR